VSVDFFKTVLIDVNFFSNLDMKLPSLAEYNALGLATKAERIKHVFGVLFAQSYSQIAGKANPITGADVPTIAHKADPRYNGKFAIDGSGASSDIYQMPVPANLVASGRGCTKYQAFELIAGSPWIGTWLGAVATPTTYTDFGGASIDTVEEMALRLAESCLAANGNDPIATIEMGEIDPVEGTPGVAIGAIPVYWLEFAIPKSGGGGN
jgi:hypothetical protein